MFRSNSYLRLLAGTLFFLLLHTPFSFATNLQLLHWEWQNLSGTNGGLWVQLTLRWQNSWHNERNHDAVWLFFKLVHPTGAGYQHLRLAADQHQLVDKPQAGSPDAAFEVPEDRAGLFVYPAKSYRGDVYWTLRIALDPEIVTNENLRRQLNDFRLQPFGIEMVKVGGGAFTLGDPDTTALAFGAFYRSDNNGQPAGLITVTSETAVIPVGKTAGDLCYRNGDPEYQGDLLGPVPATFPKGVQPFYLMKYELTQGQYAAFLSSLSSEQSQHRANFGGRDYYKNRGSIRLREDGYAADFPDRPCNFVSWDDACAYADWAGLRPFTELEYTKASRGPGTPLAGEYAWNTSSKAKLGRYVDEAGDLVWAPGLDESQLTHATRDRFGASYYWIFDLSGGALWERCITIGSPAGRAFTGSHGDGRLTGYGFAHNEDWPKGLSGAEGWGFRGGGYYFFARQYGEFNPHSPIAYRRFGAWAGGNRSIAYGSRFARTAK